MGTLQAVVIISVLLQFLNKIDRQELKPAVWKGAFAGLFGAIAIGVCFIIAFYETNEQFFKGNTEYIVEAILVSSVRWCADVVAALTWFVIPYIAVRVVHVCAPHVHMYTNTTGSGGISGPPAVAAVLDSSARRGYFPDGVFCLFFSAL